MKKSLLTLGLALCGAGMGFAQNAGVIYEGVFFTSASPNGNWLGHNMENAALIYDRSTQKEYVFFDETYVGGYFIGYGHSVTNNGMFVGSVQEANEEAAWGSYADAAYFKDGEWVKLPQISGRELGVNSVNAVTPDEWRMCGAQGPEGAKFGKDNLMLYPVIWTKNAEGNYDIQALPYPEKDFSGRAPQYVTAMDISADGKTIVGQVMDCSGFYCYPILYQQDANGEWSYRTFGTSLLWDESRLGELPVLPEQPSCPNVDDYLSAEDLAAYQAALDYYNECLNKCQSGDMDWSELPLYPSKNEYISDETKLAEYNAAMDKYKEESNAWYEIYMEFDEKLAEITTGASFVFNNLKISPNGKYALYDISAPDPNGDPDAWSPEMIYQNGVFDLSAAEPTMFSNSSTDKISNAIYDNGMFIACSPTGSYSRSSYVGHVGQDEMKPVEEYLAEAGETAAADFIKENCVFDMVDYVWNEETGMYEEVTIPGALISGTGFFTSEGKTYVSWFQDPASYNFCSLVLDLANPVAGIHNAVAAEGEGNVIGREYYNLQGQRIAAPTQGVYLEKVLTDKGVVTYKRMK